MVISTSNFPALYQQHLSHLHAVSWAVTHKPMLHSETRQTGQCALGEESLQHTLSWSLVQPHCLTTRCCFITGLSSFISRSCDRENNHFLIRSDWFLAQLSEQAQERSHLQDNPSRSHVHNQSIF